MTMIADARLDECLESLRSERGLSPATIITYTHHAKAYLAFLKNAGCAAADATPDHVTAHIGGLRQRGLRSASVFCASVAIKTFHRFLLAKGHAVHDPTTGLKSPKIVSRVSEPLSVDEVERLFAAVPGQGFAHIRDRAILEILYGCGLRIGEALGLDVGQIHMDEGYVRVRGKGSRERLVPVGPKAAEALRRYLMARRDRFGEISGPLFLSRCGTRLKKGGFGQRLKRYAARAGIAKRVHPHILRHCFSVHMLTGGDKTILIPQP
jgi:integrase/recombinase XerD